MIGDGDNPLHGEIKTPEQASRLVERYCVKAEAARLLCDVEVPGDKAATAAQQQRAYSQWLMNYGGAVGALTALHKASLISDNTFRGLQERVFQTLRPSIVGDTVNPITVPGVRL